MRLMKLGCLLVNPVLCSAKEVLTGVFTIYVILSRILGGLLGFVWASVNYTLSPEQSQSNVYSFGPASPSRVLTSRVVSDAEGVLNLSSFL